MAVGVGAHSRPRRLTTASTSRSKSKTLSETSNAENEEAKKTSAWEAILLVPSVVGTINSMNCRHKPELDWQLGYRYGLGLVVLVCVGLYVLFKRRGWI